MQNISWSDFLIILVSGAVLGVFLMMHLMMHFPISTYHHPVNIHDLPSTDMEGIMMH